MPALPVKRPALALIALITPDIMAAGGGLATASFSYSARDAEVTAGSVLGAPPPVDSRTASVQGIPR